jgi:hypothetical protein
MSNVVKRIQLEIKSRKMEKEHETLFISLNEAINILDKEGKKIKSGISELEEKVPKIRQKSSNVIDLDEIPSLTDNSKKVLNSNPIIKTLQNANGIHKEIENNKMQIDPLFEQIPMISSSRNGSTNISNSQNIIDEKIKDFRSYECYPFILYLKEPSKGKIDSFSEILTYSVPEKKCYVSKFPDEQNISSQFHRSINVGNNTLLVTGGNIKLNGLNQLSKSCWLLSWDIKEHLVDSSDKLNSYDFKYNRYPDMEEARSRHNIIYLPDKNLVFTCASIDKTPILTSEYTDLRIRKWFKINARMNNARGNATMAYIDNRFIYCIGGFQYESAKYLSSLEVIDSNTWYEWNLVNFSDHLPIHIVGPKCTMGLIQKSKNEIIIFGGFDGGNNNPKDSYVLNFAGGPNNNILANAISINLHGDYYIYYNQFFLNLKNTRKYINFNIKGTQFIYDGETNTLTSSNDVIEHFIN